MSRLFSSLQPSIPVMVALSGGVDSMALTLMAARHFKRMVAVTVDHQLRPESGDEARQVQQWVQARGIEHRIATIDWSGIDHTGSRQDASRVHRYRLLAQTCYDLGIGHILTAHHREDQAETIFMRLMHKSGVDGLAGVRAERRFIPEDTQLPLANYTLHVHRPLLDMSKDELRQVCLDHGQAWVEDPTNKLDVYERNSIRKTMQHLPAAFVDGLISTGRQHAQLASDLDGLLKPFTGSHVKVDAKTGAAEIASQCFTELPPVLQRRLARRLLHMVSGCGHPPKTEQVELAVCAMHSSSTSLSATCAGGCRISASGSVVRITRQAVPRRYEVRQASVPGRSVWWDGRFIISCKSEEASSASGHFYIRGLQQADVGLIRRADPQFKPPLDAYGSQPVICSSSVGVVAAPTFGVNLLSSHTWTAEFLPRFVLDHTAEELGD